MKVVVSKMATLKTKGATTLAEGNYDIPGVNVVLQGVGMKLFIRGLTSNRGVDIHSRNPFGKSTIWRMNMDLGELMPQ